MGTDRRASRVYDEANQNGIRCLERFYSVAPVDGTFSLKRHGTKQDAGFHFHQLPTLTVWLELPLI
jgi:hypothetical protein